MNDYITKPYSQSDLVNAVLKLKLEKQNSDITTQEQIQSNNTSEETDNVIEIFNNWETQLGKDVADKLKNALLKRIPSDINKIESFLKTSDYSKLQSAAHNLAGSLGGLNLLKGMSLTRELEFACKTSNEEIIQTLSQNLTGYLSNLIVKLN